MAKRIRVIPYGLGAIGRAAAQLALSRPGMAVVGAVDRDPRFVGRDLGEVLGVGQNLGITIADRLPQTKADAVIHCTGSHFADVYDQFIEIAGAGLHCVSSCEEALLPQYRCRGLAAKLNARCVKNSVAMVGTGVNPGFVMDTLPLTLTAVCQRVEAVRVLRVVDAGTRREALQRKVGAGMTAAQFRGLAKAHQIGHVGLTESLAFLADALGWNLDQIDESIAPVIANKTIKTPYLTVPKGAVAGQHQFARGRCGGREVLTLELQMFVGARNPRDEIRIEGVPALKMVLEGGTPGDLATPAILVNMLPRLVEARPGLHTMRSLALPRLAV